MSKPNLQEKISMIFNDVILMEQKWEYLLDKQLASNHLTTKQWLMLSAIENEFDRPPSIREVAEKMSTTRQNVKQIAVNLEKQGYLRIQRDQYDKRVLRLETTDKSNRFWRRKAKDNEKMLGNLFQTLSEREISTFYNLISKLLTHVTELQSTLKRPY